MRGPLDDDVITDATRLVDTRVRPRTPRRRRRLICHRFGRVAVVCDNRSPSTTCTRRRDQGGVKNENLKTQLVPKSTGDDICYYR